MTTLKIIDLVEEYGEACSKKPFSVRVKAKSKLIEAVRTLEDVVHQQAQCIAELRLDLQSLQDGKLK